MFGMTTFMFVLGIIALVTVTALEYQWLKVAFAGNKLGHTFFNTSTVWATITRLMVRYNDTIMLSA